MRKLFDKIIVGSVCDGVSEVDYKIAKLRGQLAILGVIVGITYFFIDKLNLILGNDLYYLSIILVSLLTLWLNRIRKYMLASVIFILLLNFIVFLFASKDPYRLGTHMFFILDSIIAFALFGYKGRKYAFVASLFSVTLFMLSYPLSVFKLNAPVLSEEFIHINFSINFGVAMITCIAIVYFLIDINYHTEREILNKNELLVKANAELDSFVYRASHDLRSPLSSILGLAEIGTITNDPTEIKACFKMIKERVGIQDQFISEIIDYSRNTRLEIRKERFILKPLISHVIEILLYNENTEQIIDFQLDIADDFEISTDRVRLQVILSNLISNAIKYRDADKPNSFIKLNAKVVDSKFQIIVEDNGIGIEEEHWNKIFGMFYRATEASKGSGLGLYIVQETLHRLGGKITFTSVFGKGTSFVLTIPCY